MINFEEMSTQHVYIASLPDGVQHKNQNQCVQWNHHEDVYNTLWLPAYGNALLLTDRKYTHNYAQESKRKSGRNQSKERPQSERKASQATHSQSESGNSDRGQSGKQEAIAFRAEISLAPVQFVGQYFAMELWSHSKSLAFGILAPRHTAKRHKLPLLRQVGQAWS